MIIRVKTKEQGEIPALFFGGTSQRSMRNKTMICNTQSL